MDKYYLYFIFLFVNIGYIECSVNYRCENTTLKINCYYGNVINITNAFYGRDNSTYCLTRNSPTNQQCSLNNITTIIGNRCNNNHSCTVYVNSTSLGDPCPGVSKYLRVKHFCFKPINQIYSKYQCQNKTVYLYCPYGGTINITQAFYGRDNISCSLNNATAVISNMCNNNNSCIIFVNSTDLPDPCPGAQKYLRVNYSCKPKQCPSNEHLEAGACGCGDMCPGRTVCPFYCINEPTCVCNSGLCRNVKTHTCVQANQTSTQN